MSESLREGGDVPLDVQVVRALYDFLWVVINLVWIVWLWII